MSLGPPRSTARLAPIAVGLLAAALLGGCGSNPEHCEWPPYESAAAPQTQSALHADFAQLRPWHRYSRVSSVGEYGHHFAVTYRCIEPFLLYVTATEPRGGDTEWILEAGWWGGMAVPQEGRTERIPNQVEDLADELRDRIEAETDARDIEITYLGAYREVEVEEIIPTHGPAIAANVGWSASVVLGTDEAMTQLTHGVLRAESGFGMFCYDGCVSPPYWIAETPQADSDWPLLRDGSTAAFQALPGAWRGDMLAAARALEDGAQRLPLDQLPGLDDHILPPDLDQSLGVTWTLYARPIANAGEQDSAELTLFVPTNRLAFSREEQRIEGDVELAGVTFHLQIRLLPDNPLPFQGSGSAALTVALEVVVDDSRGNHAEGRMIMQGDVLYDGGRAASIGLTPTVDPRDPLAMGHHYRFELPGTAGVASFDVYPDPQLEMVAGP